MVDGKRRTTSTGKSDTETKRKNENEDEQSVKNGWENKAYATELHKLNNKTVESISSPTETSDEREIKTESKYDSSDVRMKYTYETCGEREINTESKYDRNDVMNDS